MYNVFEDVSDDTILDDACERMCLCSSTIQTNYRQVFWSSYQTVEKTA